MESKKRLWTGIGIIGVIVIVVLVVVFGQQKTPSDTDPYKIGAAFGLSGETAVWGEASLNAAKLAVADINQKGGINGRKLELVVEDMKSSSKDAVLAMSKLRDIDKVDAYMTTWLDVYPGPEALLPEGKILISPDAGVEAVNGEVVHSRVFSNWYRTQVKSDLAVKHMKEQGKTKLYIIVQKDPYYDGVTKFMTEAALKYGVEVVGTESLNPESDIKAVLPKVTSSGADTVFFSFYDQKLNSEFLKRKVVLDKNIAFYGDELVQQSFESPDYAKTLFEGIYFYAPRQPDKKFFDRYVSSYKTEPVFGAGPTYDAVHMIAEVLRDNPEDIDSYMRSRTFGTVSYGEVTFDEIGGVSSPDNYFTIKQVQNGVAVPVTK